MAKDFNSMIKNANKRIETIKEYGMQPITLKSPADKIRRFIEPKGTSMEGQFKTYAEVRSDNPSITREEYENVIKSFLDSPYGSQTYFSEAFKYYEKIINQLEEIEMFEEQDIKNMQKLSRREFIEMVEKAGELSNAERKEYGTSGSFYEYIYQYLEERFG